MLPLLRHTIVAEMNEYKWASSILTDYESNGPVFLILNRGWPNLDVPLYL